jgi:hypothetical protein
MWCRDRAPPLGASSQSHPATGNVNREVNSNDCASGEFATGFSARFEANFFDCIVLRHRPGWRAKF